MKKQIHYILITKNDSLTVQISAAIASIESNANISIINNYDDANILLQENRLSIIFCDDSISDIIPYDLCSEIKGTHTISPFYFIFMGENLNQDFINILLSKGVDDYLNLPINNDSLKNRIRIARKITSLQLVIAEENHILKQLKNELERDIDDIIKLSLKFMQIKLPSIEITLNKVADASVWIAKHFENLDEKSHHDIKIASYLCLAGKAFLPNEMQSMPITQDGIPTNSILAQIPHTNKEIANSIKRFKNVGEILYHIYENIDGSGFPERKQQWQIPLESRIIRVTLEFYLELNNLKSSAKDIATAMSEKVNRLYDQRVVYLLEQYIRLKGNEDYDPSEIAILPIELKEGMTISRDLVTVSGIKLISQNTKLSDRAYNLVMNHISSDPIIGYIFIKR